MESVERTFVEKKLKKMSSQQLLKKIESDQFSADEKEVALTILEQRTTEPSTEVFAPESVEDVNAGEFSAEDVAAAVDVVYSTADAELIKGLISLFKRDVNNYSELTQEERAAIINYANSIKNPESAEALKTTEKKDKPAVKKETKEKGESKSKAIRALLRQGKSVSEVAKELGIRYNFVYNVGKKLRDIQK